MTGYIYICPVNPVSPFSRIAHARAFGRATHRLSSNVATSERRHMPCAFARGICRSELLI